MLLTLHNYKEKKNTLTFVRYELMTFFLDDVLFLLQKRCGEAEVSPNLNHPPLHSRSLCYSF